MEVEAVLAASGALAPSLGKLIKSGRFDQTAERAFDRFCEALLISDVVLARLAPRNILYGVAGGGQGFKLIDDFGDSRAISWKRVVKGLNTRHKRALISRMRRKIEELKGKGEGRGPGQA